MPHRVFLTPVSLHSGATNYQKETDDQNQNFAQNKSPPLERNSFGNNKALKI
jgi:hypothetical protein